MSKPLTSSGRSRGLTILGSTGSIGRQALEVVRQFPERLRVVALTAHRSSDLLASQALEFRPECVALTEGSGCRALQEALLGSGVRVLAGPEGLSEAAALPQADVVLGAITGVAGLRPVLKALKAGKTLALANKETLVAGGRIAMETARTYGGVIIPVDSEHSAIFQCLAGEQDRTVETLVLTASGGPFRTRDVETFGRITPQEALRHPNWSMGPKVTIDSATMMNKGLEVIEAYWLFGVQPSQIEVVVHPQSIVHSLVTFTDGSTKAQLGQPDMRLPIQYALTYPDRWPSPRGRVDWSAGLLLEFSPPDLDKFPCLRLAYDALRAGGSAPAVLNAANEEAVALFLREELRFTDIPHAVEQAIEHLGVGGDVTYQELLEVDQAARRLVREKRWAQTE